MPAHPFQNRRALPDRLFVTRDREREVHVLIEFRARECVRLDDGRVFSLEREDIGVGDRRPRLPQRRILAGRNEPRVERSDRRTAHETIRAQRRSVCNAAGLRERTDESRLKRTACAATAQDERIAQDLGLRTLWIQRRKRRGSCDGRDGCCGSHRAQEASSARCHEIDALSEHAERLARTSCQATKCGSV
jgi:hypothetical protein